MNAETLGRIRAGLVRIARETIRRAVAARPESVQFSQGTYDAVVRDLPELIADATARAVILERDHEVALGKIVMQQMRIDDLQDRLAALEAKQPARSTDAGNVVHFEAGIIRHIASA